MAKGETIQVVGEHPLPPLILHPFTESSATVRMLESARSSLEALRNDGAASEPGGEIEQRLLDGRFTELRMLFYVGKDVQRWIEQCVEACERVPELEGRLILPQTFAQMLIEQTPADVEEKLRSWGVIEYARIFSRAIGIYNQFREPPDIAILQADYLRYYYRYADYAYSAWRDLRSAPILAQSSFPFTLFASGEYARILEEQWKEG